MRSLILTSALFTSLFFNSAVQAGEVPSQAPTQRAEIPTLEREFVDAIHHFDKAKIIAQFGEPAKAEDVKLKDSNKVVASIWHYHYINTNLDGVYYQTTELDFIDDKVVMVVFMNHDGSEANDGQKYELPAEKPEL